MMLSSIGKGGPWAMTRAERWAIIHHASGCPACIEWVRRTSDEYAAKNGLTPEQRTRGYAAGAALVAMDRLSDDPEIDTSPPHG
jgi:hypothetical protein